MPTDSDFDQSLNLAQQLHDPKWVSYAAYLTRRGEGLRKPALQQLNEFIGEAQTWAFADRWRFTAFLLEHLQGFTTYSNPLPHPLVTHLLRPTLLEAHTAFPRDPRPPYWLAMEGIYAWQSENAIDQREIWLREAIARDATFQTARLALVNNILSGVAWHQHELPWGYLGIATEDLKALGEVKSLLLGAEPTAFSRRLDLEHQALEATAKQYITYRNSKEPFYRDWCDKNGLPYVHEEGYLQ